MEPDGLLGAMVGSESLGLTDTMVNGAGGCRSRAQIVLHDLLPDYEPEDPRVVGCGFMSRQSRLPCTYLNNEDIVFGAGGKVSRGLSEVSGLTGRRTLLLDTLGASLLCTDDGLLSDGDAPVRVCGDLSSMSFHEGYDAAVAAIMGTVELDSGEDGSVNLLGYGISDPGWEAGAEELASLLGAMGARVNAVLGCRPSPDRLRACGRASLNVMVRPEMCSRTASLLAERTGADALRPSLGAPVGYEATRSFLREVAEALELDPSPALRIVDEDEGRVRAVLMNYDRMPTGLHARGLAIECESSTAYPLLRWMHERFGMAPRLVRCPDRAYADDIRAYLGSAGFGDAVDGTDGEVELVFTDGLSAMRGNLDGRTTGYVEVRMPRGRNMDLMGRCVVGTRGCRYILDEAFNSVRRFRCGQPTEVDMRPGCCPRRRISLGIRV